MYPFDKFCIFIILSDLCNYEFEGESGIFTTKNFPELYEVSSNCTWKIKVADGYKVKLTFHSFDVSNLNIVLGKFDIEADTISAWFCFRVL